MKIYKTDDIEGSIRNMSGRNDSSIVFQFPWLLRQVKERLNLVADIPSVLVRSWDCGAQKTIKKWKSEKGLMYYRHMRGCGFDIMPTTDALLFTGCPLHERDLFEFKDRARSEIIIYRPPDWSMHDEMMDFKYPMHEAYRRTLAAILSMKGNELTRNQELALRYSGLPKNKTIVFSHGDLEKLAGIQDGQFKRMFKYKHTLLSRYTRYDLYKPMFEPVDADLMGVYRLLEEQPDAGGGMRMLRFGNIEKRIRFFEKYLAILVKSKCVARYEPVHLIIEGWKEMNYEVEDAVSTAHRAGCLRLRKIVEDAPDYSISGG